MKLHDSTFLSFDGESIAGRVPVTLVVDGNDGVLTAQQEGGVARAYKVFCDAKRLSLIDYHMQHYVLADGTTIQMTSIHGVDSVRVAPTAGGAQQKVADYFRAVAADSVSISGTAPTESKSWKFHSTPSEFPASLKDAANLDDHPGHVSWCNTSLKLAGKPIVVSWRGPRDRYATTTGWSSPTGTSIVPHNEAGHGIGTDCFTDTNAIWIDGRRVPIDPVIKVIAACFFQPDPVGAPGLFLARVITDRYPAGGTTRAVATYDLAPNALDTTGVSLKSLCEAKTLYTVATHVAADFSASASSLGKWNLLQRPHFNKSGTALATGINYNGVTSTDNLTSTTTTVTAGIGVSMDPQTWAINQQISAPFRHQFVVNSAMTGSGSKALDGTGSASTSGSATTIDSHQYLMAVDFEGDTLAWMKYNLTQTTVDAESSSHTQTAINDSNQTATTTDTKTAAWSVEHSVMGVLYSESHTITETVIEGAVTTGGASTTSGTHAFPATYFASAMLVGDLSKRTFTIGHTAPSTVQDEAVSVSGSGAGTSASTTGSQTRHAQRLVFDVWIDGTLAASATTGAFTNAADVTGTESISVGFNGITQAEIFFTTISPGTSSSGPAGGFGSPVDTTVDSSGLGGSIASSLQHCAVHSSKKAAYLGAQVSPSFPDSLAGLPQSGLELCVFNGDAGTSTQNTPVYSPDALPTLSAPVFTGPVIESAP